MLALCDQMLAAANDLVNSARNEEQFSLGLQAMEGAREIQAGVEAGIDYLEHDG